MGLDTVEIVVLTEKKFGVHIPDEAAENIATVGQLIDFVAKEVNEDSGRVAREIIRIVSEVSGIPPHEIKSEHSFTNDLGLD